MIKKISIAIVIIFFTLLLVVIILPFALKNKVRERVQQELSERIDARIELGDFKLSLIRHFPNVSLRLDGIRVIGNEPFQTDTLADIGRLFVSLDLRSVFGDSDYEVNNIRLDDASFLFILLEDGQANWDIYIPSPSDGDEAESEDPAAEEPGNGFSLTLKEVDIRRSRVVYHDDKSLTYIDASDINGVFTGDLAMELTTLATRDARIGAFSLRYDTWPLLSRASVLLTAEMDLDLNQFVFTFRDNELMINELPLVFEGMVGWPDDDLEMDFRFGAARADFSSFLSLVPALYTKDFGNLETGGTLKLEGFVKGAMTDTAWPGFGLTLEVNNGMFRYPALPASVSNVQIMASILNPGPDLDLTVIDIPDFSMDLGGNPLEARFRLATPVSDPQIDARIVGNLDLGMVQAFYPLEEGVVLGGRIESDVEMRGRLSAIEAGNYTDFHADGHLIASEVEMAGPGFEQGFEVATADFRFNPRMVRMDAFEARFGESDLGASGQIDNLPGYLFDGQLLSGSFSTRSAFLNLNEMMDVLPESETQEETELSVIRVPANIDFTLDAVADRVVFGKIDLRNVEGKVRLVDEQASLDNLRMNLLGGDLEINGLYDTREELPRVDFGLAIGGFDIRETFQTFNVVRILAPVAEFATGGFSANLQLNTLLDETLSPVLSSLEGSGGLRSSSVRLEGTPSMTALADHLKIDALNEISVRDLVLSFVFGDGKVELPPFDMRFGNVTANVSGATYFDQRVSYTMNFEIPRSLFGSQANQVLENLVSEASGLGVEFSPGEMIPVDVLIGGTFRKPELAVSLAALRDRVEQQLMDEANRLLRETEDRLRQEADQARQQVEDEVEERVEEVEERVGEEVEARVAQIMETANRQADNIRRTANNAAETVRKEAREQAERLEREAQGPIAQAAARRTAQALISQADRRAAEIEAEGERNAQRVIDEAQQQVDRIRNLEE